MNRDSKRLAKIKSDRIELLKKVKDSISSNSNNLSEEITTINEVIKQDDESIKKLETIEKTKELITNLVEQIVDAKTHEEVEALRKKINSLINKIKKELYRRNLSEETIIEYQSKVTYLRKDIAKFIRYLKRNSIIDEIENKIENYNNLTIEEMTRLKKLLRNEVSYNTRNFKEKVVKKEVVKPVIVPKIEEVVEEENKSIEEFDFSKPFSSEEIQSLFTKKDSPEEKVVETVKMTDEEYQEKMSEYLRQKAIDFNTKYRIKKIYEYSDSKIDNIKGFLSNIPLYIRNRRKIKAAYKDLKMYGGGDLISYTEYVKRRNSIKTGLKCIFDKSYLISEEGRCLNIHDNCSEWLYNFCERNSLNFPLLYKTRTASVN